MMDELRQTFRQHFGTAPEIYVRAPGRVNLIGEHTDYNDGFVFPIAIDRQIEIMATRRSDRKVVIFSPDFDATESFMLDDIRHVDDSWCNYPKGVAYFLQKGGHELTGGNAVITGNIPLGAGLSSSAAVEVASALMFTTLADVVMDKSSLALLCQRAENQFVGVHCGIMDQFISLMGKKDHALLLDCRSLEYDRVPIPMEDMRVVVCNTRVKRKLTGSEYNERRAECERGVEMLKEWLPDIHALRDVDSQQFKKYEAELPPLTQKRCRYVIDENERVLASVAALRARDYERFGELMFASHRGLRDDYEVSCLELDLMVEIASGVDGVLGARMTGAGFGGCTVNLVRESSVSAIEAEIQKRYPQETGIQPEVYICQIADGASVSST